MSRPSLMATVVAVVILSACGGPSVEPIGEGPTNAAGDDTSAGGPVDGCRPALGADDPHPIRDSAGGRQDPGLSGAWVGELAQTVQTQHTDVLGGIWLDNEAGEVVIMVPGTDGREVFELLRQEAAEPERVVCMEATYTEDELLSLQREIGERLTAGGAAMGSGVDTVMNIVTVDYEGDLDEARDLLGELADHEAVQLAIPDCAAVDPPPEGATLLPGGGSNCMGMDALFEGVLAGDAASGCAWFENDAGEPLAVLWPRGWSITEDGTIVDHRGEERATLGDRVSSGGGNVPLQEGQQACGTGGEGAWVVSSLDRAEGGAGEG